MSSDRGCVRPDSPTTPRPAPRVRGTPGGGSARSCWPRPSGRVSSGPPTGGRRAWPGRLQGGGQRDRPREEIERQVGHIIERRTDVAFLRNAHESTEVILQEEES